MAYTVPKLDDYSPEALDRAAGVTKIQPERSEGDTIC
jgi:hypothetical protein